MIDVGFAGPEDAEAVADLLRRAALRMPDLGGSGWSPDEFHPEETGGIIARGEQVRARREDSIVGVARFQLADPIYWPDRPDDEAAYLHKLAVDPEARGTGVTDAIVAWAAGEAKRIGRRFLRLDCPRAPRLRALYERLGFVHVDDRHVEIWMHRMERRL